MLPSTAFRVSPATVELGDRGACLSLPYYRTRGAGTVSVRRVALQGPPHAGPVPLARCRLYQTHKGNSQGCELFII